MALSNPTLVSSIYAAIKQMEGANPANNNPGNVMDLAYYKQTGLYRPAVYSTQAQGDAANEALIQSYVNQGLTLDQFFAKWAPAGHGSNNPAAYSVFVSAQTGLPTDVPLASLSDIGGGGGTMYASTGTTGGTDAGADGPPMDMPVDYAPVTADASQSGLMLAGLVLAGVALAMAVD